MKFSLPRFFKREKASTETAVADIPVARPVIEKPASERFGKTVMPNTARVMEPAARSGGARPFSLGDNFMPDAAPQLAPAPERTIALQLSEVLPQIPTELVQSAATDPEQRLIFQAAELERGMANGRPAVLLRSIYQQVPALFAGEIGEEDAREIALPFQKVLEQFSSLQVRADQEPTDAVPEVETPFLKVTLEDRQKFGMPIPAPALAAEAVVAAVVKNEVGAPVATPKSGAPPVAAAEPVPASPAPKVAARAPIRLSMPTELAPVAPAPVPAPAAAPSVAPALPKIFPHGAGAPITERVPASSGSPAPITLPAPLAPAPVRIPFKVTPPASDPRPPSAPPAEPAAPLVISTDGPRVKISLRAVLRGIPPFQCTGPIDQVPEGAQIELPFAIVEPQLSLGRVAISPAQFHAALPEEYRALYKFDEGAEPVALPLPEILRHLPNESLQLRVDQEEPEVAQHFETPFSQKAAEDAARMKVPVGPITKPAAAFAAPSTPNESAVLAGKAESVRSKLPQVVPKAPASPVSPDPAPTTAGPTPLQIVLETDDPLDAKSVVAHVSQLAGVKACAIVFSDGLSLAGNIPDVYETDALCALAPEIMKRIDGQMKGVNLGPLQGVTIHCEKAPVSFFAHQNICLAVLHSTSHLTDEIRARLDRTTQELAQMYAQPPVA